MVEFAGPWVDSRLILVEKRLCHEVEKVKQKSDMILAESQRFEEVLVDLS